MRKTLLIVIIFCIPFFTNSSLIKNPTENDGPKTVTDIDGNVYITVKIDNQLWMAENLKVTHYRNGDAIPHVTDDSTWVNLTTGAYCNYDNNDTLVATYGRLYNWHALIDPRGLEPAGWHVPTDAEWKELEMYLGMSQSDADVGEKWRGTDEGTKMKSASGWKENGNGSNSCGFSALPGALRSYDGKFTGMMGYLAPFWSSSDYDSDYVWYRVLQWNNSKVRRKLGVKIRGFAVRCVKD